MINNFIIQPISKVVLSFLLLSICSCGDSQSQGGEPSRSSQISLERYIEVNRQLIDSDQRKIEEYLEQEGLVMERTQTGLWYDISEPGTGSAITTGDVVTLDYKVWLMDGTLCYSSDSLGHKVFMVGHGGVESGLEEGILLLKEGSIATFIMAPHLAHGLIGDDDKIPYRATLKYYVEVLNVEDK